MKRLTISECRNYIKHTLADGKLSSVSCRTDNDEDYERVFAKSTDGWYWGTDFKDIEQKTGMHINYLWVSPAGALEWLFVRPTRNPT